MSGRVEITHFADAGCPWDYSAEPVRIALEERYGDQLAWRTIQVGLHESGAAMARRGYTTAGLAESYRIFQERHGMPFCTEERPRLRGTWPGARAVKAAERQSPAAGAMLLRRLRLAWFIEVRPMDEREGILQLAAEIDSLDLERFATDLDGEVSMRDLEHDMAAARRPDRVALALEKTARPAGEAGPRYTTPTYILSFEGHSTTVPGFQPREAYEVALQNLAPELERRRPPDASEFLGGRRGALYATVEVAAAIGRSKRRTAEQLEALVQAEPVQRTVAGAREFWSWGPPAIRAECPALPQLPVRLERELAA